MNTCTTPFDKTIGNSISPQMTELLLSLFDDIKIIDIKQFQEKYEFEPCISSRFMVTEGGTCYFKKNGYHIVTHNGTLHNIIEVPQVIRFMALYP